MPKPLDAAQVWTQIEDHLIPFLRLNAPDRAVYYQLFRHSRLLGQRTVLVSRRGLARSSGLGFSRIFHRVHSLARKGCLRVVERHYNGHLLEVLMPSEVPGCLEFSRSARRQPKDKNAYRDPELRAAILQREDNRCFYCLRHLRSGAASFDHVLSISQGGSDSFANLVACCIDCNSTKSSLPADDFLRSLFRAGRLSAAELNARLAALASLRSNEAKPILPPPA